jgi:hypothetical protein
LERHNAGETRVIPIILRPCDWQETPFGKLLAAPTDGKAVTRWPDHDEAFLDVTKAIRKAVQTHASKGKIAGNPSSTPVVAQPMAARTEGPRSSNLRMLKVFSEHDQDVFLDDCFGFMARFFENSLAELKERNPGYEATFKRIDSNKFTATIYRDGEAVCRCQIRLGGMFGKGIEFSYGSNVGDNSINESMSVELGEQSLYLKPMGLAMFGASEAKGHLSAEGAAEYFWELFLQPLQNEPGRRRRG